MHSRIQQIPLSFPIPVHLPEPSVVLTLPTLPSSLGCTYQKQRPWVHKIPALLEWLSLLQAMDEEKSCSLRSAECRSLSVILPSLEEKKKKRKKKEKLSSATQGDKLYLAGNSGFPGAFLISPSSKMGITYLIHVEWRCLIPQQRGEVCACQLHKYVDSKLFLNALRNLFEDVQQIMD